MEEKSESTESNDYDITTLPYSEHDTTTQYDITTPGAQTSCASRPQAPSFSSLLTTVQSLLLSLTTVHYAVTGSPSVVDENITLAEVHLFTSSPPF